MDIFVRLGALLLILIIIGLTLIFLGFFFILPLYILILGILPRREITGVIVKKAKRKHLRIGRKGDYLSTVCTVDIDVDGKIKTYLCSETIYSKIPKNVKLSIFVQFNFVDKYKRIR